MQIRRKYTANFLKEPEHPYPQIYTEKVIVENWWKENTQRFKDALMGLAVETEVPHKTSGGQYNSTILVRPSSSDIIAYDPQLATMFYNWDDEPPAAAVITIEVCNTPGHLDRTKNMRMDYQKKISAGDVKEWIDFFEAIVRDTLVPYGIELTLVRGYNA